MNNIKLYILEEARNGVYRVQLIESGIYVRSLANTMIALKILPNFMTFLAAFLVSYITKFWSVFINTDGCMGDMEDLIKQRQVWHLCSSLVCDVTLLYVTL